MGVDAEWMLQIIHTNFVRLTHRVPMAQVEDLPDACCFLSHTWVTWQKYSSHSVCPWGQVSSQGCHLVLESSV